MQDLKTYQPAPNALQDRVILITGATDGIGKALAIAAANLGTQVIAHGRTQRKLEAVANLVTDPATKPMALLPLDFEKAGPAEYEAMVEAIEQNFGRLDGLVHNAAMLGERAPIEHHDVQKWLRTMHVNTNAPFILTRYCLPLLKKSADASIIFSSCDVATEARAHWGPYLVSKWANEGMMRMLADELGNTRVRVNSVNPGSTNTKIRMQAFPAEDRELLAKPAEVVNPYLYLLGNDSKGVTGQQLENHAAA
jgi:NAD(P)-dependent dehydrogenase (short-subunit alcohol dehydrogenase family)